MEFLKRNAFILICLLVGLVSIGLGLVACTTFGTIQESLDQAASFGTQLASAGKVSGRKDPVVPRDIEVQKQNKETMQAAIQEALQTALVVNETGLDYMVPEAFPTAVINDNMQLAFIKKYRAAIGALPEILDAKGPPTQVDIDRVQQEIDRENEELGLDTKRTSSARPAAPTRERPTRSERRGGGMQLLAGAALSRARDARLPSRGTQAGPARPALRPDTEKPIDEKEELRRNAKRRAELERAASIRCYVDEPNSTFTVVEAARDALVAPDPNAMWEAQMGVWVQREFCIALSQVNEDAAKALKAKDPDARVDVTTLPIKRLIRLAVGDYRFTAPLETTTAKQGPAKRAARPSRGEMRRLPQPVREKRPFSGFRGVPGAKSETPEPGQEDLRRDLIGPTWTGREGGEQLDVVPVAMRLVMDVRYLPRVIDTICRTNFVVPTRVSYRQLNRADLEGPYVYGPDPVAEVTLAFERYFFPSVYAEKMPPSVHGRLGHRIVEEAEEGVGGGRRTNTGPRGRG